jgi:acetyltransferase-like isoleucine patch superfamily enzyme
MPQESSPAVGSPAASAAAPKKLHGQLTDERASALKRYRAMVLGRGGLWSLIRYEIIMLLVAPLPGAAGLVLRRLFYPRILGSVGREVIFGRNITIRHGTKIRLGDRVVVDDNAVLDAKGEGNAGIEIGADTIVSRNCVLSCKGGSIRIGRNVSMGINSLVHAVAGSDVMVGDDAAIAAFTYLIGGGNYRTERLDIAFKEQGDVSRGGVVVENGVWIGSHVQVLDGVRVGAHSILAAGAVVTKDVPRYSVVGGVPARLIRSRLEETPSTSDPGAAVPGESI